MNNVIINPSLLAADMSKLDFELKRMKDEEIKYLHIDVMDGKFVDNISFDLKTISYVCSKFNFINDVHLMIENPQIHYFDYIKAGANILTFHYESLNDDEEVEKLIDLIHKENVKVGISLKPKTPVEKIIKFLTRLDLVLVMSVEPGYGGQAFMSESLEKIRSLSKIKKENNLNFIISVDGGINDVTGILAKTAGADMLVSGTYLFKSKNLKEAIEKVLK